jgi:N-acetylglutamate synthase-like GNAT family acetyltransferase
MIIRSMLPNEVEVLRAIEKKARGRYRSLSGFEKFADTPPIAADRFSIGWTVVATLGEVPVGFAIVQRIDVIAYLANISVEPEASGEGVGSSLLAKAEQDARDLGLSRMALATFKEPSWNGPWFRRLGFSLMPAENIVPGFQAILQRHATFLDMSIRETLWKILSDRLI